MALWLLDNCDLEACTTTAAELAGIGGLVGQVATVLEALLVYNHFRTVLEAEPDLPAAADPMPVPALRHGSRVARCAVPVRA
ncbi:hypothetical protein [Flindersiella endophytica]